MITDTDDPAWSSFCASVLATLARTSTNTRASFVFQGVAINAALRMHDRTVTWQVGSAAAQTMDVPTELARVLQALASGAPTNLQRRHSRSA